MKKTILFIAFLFGLSLLEHATAQNWKIGITATPPFGDFGVGPLGTTADPTGMNSPSYTEKRLYAIGIVSQLKLSSRWDLETGIEFNNYTFLVDRSHYSPNPPNNDYVAPPSYRTKLGLLTFPITAKVNFWKYFFANGGALIDIDVSSTSESIDSQTGLGATLGIGGEYDFKFGGTLFVNPYLRCHGLVPFSSWESERDRILEAGIRVGFMFDLSTFKLL